MLKTTKFFLIAAFLAVAMITGCTAEEEEAEPTPEEAFEEYASYWEKGNYEMMYELLSLQSKEVISKERFVERYTNIFSGIEATDLTVKMFVVEITEDEQLEEKEKEKEKEKEPPIEVALRYEQQMETFAGQLYFDSEVKLQLEIEETEAEETEAEVIKKWAIDWTPAMIFPPLEEGDEVRPRTLHPKRGELVDRNESGLAVNGEVNEIGIVPELLPEEAIETIEEVAKLLRISVEEVERKLNQSWVRPDTIVPLKSISLEEQQLLAELREIQGVTSKKLLVGCIL